MLRGKALCILALVMLTLVAGNACSSRHAGDGATNSSTLPTGTPTPAVATPEAVIAPINWSDIEQAYARVSDYVCLYEKVERAISNGERQTIRLYFRKPFDVRMEWLGVRGAVDQRAVYRQGANEGKVVARQNGLLGSMMGTVRLDPNESLALTDSRHPITEVSLGKIIERAKHDAGDARIVSRFVGEDTLDGRPAYEFEFKGNKDAPVFGVADARRAVIWIDREQRLPVKLELYDDANTLLESHRFKDVRVNTKLADKIFTL